MPDNIFTNIGLRAFDLDHRLFIPEDGPAWDEIYRAASHKKWRVKLTAAPDGASTSGVDDALAWFPADDAVFPGHACVSAALTTEGHWGPTSRYLGFAQFHRDVAIWLQWKADGINDEYSVIEWKDIGGDGFHLYGTDDSKNNWQFEFQTWYAGVAPTWPDWLLD